MAEQVNQRIEDMINELEQMRRTNLYTDEEIRDISRKRKEFEYRIQRRTKTKDDFVQYIAYELTLLEDMSLRRKQTKLMEKKNDLEYAVAKRLNKIFKQLIFRFQNDVAIFFEYIKFCRSVGFDHAISAMIGVMLQIHGDKPKAWQLASKWESKELNNLDSARNFLLKGIHRHPEAAMLYLDLFEIELMIAFKAEEEEDKEKYLKRADVVWRNGAKNVTEVSYLFRVCDMSLKYNLDESMTKAIKEEIWKKRSEQEVWSYIAAKELEGCHWSEIEVFAEEHSFSNEITYYTAAYEEALRRFPDEKLCTKYIHGLLSLNESLCTESQKINIVKHAWKFGHEKGLLTNDMYEFGISVLKMEGEMTKEELNEILDVALANNPQHKYLWEEKIMLNKQNENQLLSILQDAGKKVKSEDLLHLWNFMLDNSESSLVFKNCYKKFQNCESAIILSLKPKILQKIFEHNGIKAARQVYEEFIRTPPAQIDVHKIMIEIEMSQEKPVLKNVRKCYECLIQQYGKTNIEIWLDYMKFETQNGAHLVPAIHRRAIANLNKDIVDEFIKVQALTKLK